MDMDMYIQFTTLYVGWAISGAKGKRGEFLVSRINIHSHHQQKQGQQALLSPPSYGLPVPPFLHTNTTTRSGRVKWRGRAAGTIYFACRCWQQLLLHIGEKPRRTRLECKASFFPPFSCVLIPHLPHTHTKHRQHKAARRKGQPRRVTRKRKKNDKEQQPLSGWDQEGV